MPPSAGTQRRYPEALKKKAVRMVRELRAETGESHGAIGRVATQLGVGVESLRVWVKRDEIERGEVNGPTSALVERNKELEAENKELRRANSILKSASAFFAAELDRPQR